MTEHLRKGFRLGAFEVRPLTGTIRGPSGTHHIPPTAMEVLVCLAASPGEIVSREFLVDKVWKSDSVGETALTRCIGDIRTQLDDHADDPQYVQTIPRRGYRLLADVVTIPDTTPPADANGSYATFFEELRRRRVIRVALVYMVAAWVIIQVAQTTFPALLLPDWSVTLVVVLVVFGLPVALILAWAFQVESAGTDHTATTVQYVVDKNRKIDFVVITGLAAVVAIMAYELYVRESPTISTADAPPGETLVAYAQSDKPSIAVLPFVNLSDDPQNEYFGDGLAEEILNLLVRVKELGVAARTSSFFFKGKNVDIKTVANHLGVSNVLEGSVRRHGDTIRVTAQLIDVKSGFHLWSETYNRQFQDIFTIQDDIARQVVAALEIALSKDSAALLDRVPTNNVDAFEYYLKGRDYLRGERDEMRLQSARELFERATALDSKFAEAYAGLCETFLSFYELSRSTEYFEKAERACHRGLTLNIGAGDVNVALGNLYRASGQNDKAENEFTKALALNNRDVNAYSGLAETYKRQNRLDAAERTLQYVIDIQPGFWRGHLEMGNFLYYAGRISESIVSFTKVVNLAPDNATGYLNLGASYYLLGDFEDAASAWRTSLELKPSASAYLNVGSSYFFLHRFDEAAEMYLQATQLSPDDFETWGALADAYRFSDQSSHLAAAAYEKAIALGEKLLDVNPANAPTMAALAQYYASTGNNKRAMDLIAGAHDLEPNNFYVQYFSATTNARVGNTSSALDSIEMAVELGYPTALLAVDAGLSPLAGDDRFKALISGSAN